VVETGTHEQLARAGGLYERFVDEQRRESEMSRLNTDFSVAPAAEAEAVEAQ